MRCPFCGDLATRVLDTRPIDDGSAMRRRRACDACAGRFTTYERVARDVLSVRKRDGRLEPFDAEKVRVGVEKALGKRPASAQHVSDITDRVEACVRSGEAQVVESHEVGRLVLEELKGIDHVAYLRFASVHQEFQDAERFIDAAESLGVAPENNGVNDAPEGVADAG